MPLFSELHILQTSKPILVTMAYLKQQIFYVGKNAKDYLDEFKANKEKSENRNFRYGMFKMHSFTRSHLKKQSHKRGCLCR